MTPPELAGDLVASFFAGIRAATPELLAPEAAPPRQSPRSSPVDPGHGTRAPE